MYMSKETDKREDCMNTHRILSKAMGVHSKKRALLFIWLFVALCGCQGKRECKREGEQWCEGNKLVSCVGWQENFVLSSRRMTTHCSAIEIPSTCVATEQSDGTTLAACVVDETPCDKGQVSMCRDDSLIVCGKTHYPEFDRHCRGAAMRCVVNEEGNAAGCAHMEGICAPGDSVCDSDVPTRYYRCDNDGFWSQQLICEEEEGCSSRADGGVGCGDETFLDGGVEDFK